MALTEPTVCRIEVAEGRLAGGTRYEKALSDLAGLYADAPAFDHALAAGDRTVYAVTDFRPSARPGDLIHGVTRMSPGRIGDEFFLTRGHLHAIADRPEIYRGESGRGVMLLEAPDGTTRAVAIDPGDVCYVPPYWIHRSVNVGEADLVMSFAYPADAGQDYDIIARAGGMRRRIVADGAGGWRAVDNAAWRPRAAAEVARLMGEAA